MPDFRFAIGDIVQLKAAPNHKAMILERSWQECPGGVQRYYVVRLVVEKDRSFGGVKIPIEYAIVLDSQRFLEFELEP